MESGAGEESDTATIYVMHCVKPTKLTAKPVSYAFWGLLSGILALFIIWTAPLFKLFPELDKYCDIDSPNLLCTKLLEYYWTFSMVFAVLAIIFGFSGLMSKRSGNYIHTLSCFMSIIFGLIRFAIILV